MSKMLSNCQFGMCKITSIFPTSSQFPYQCRHFHSLSFLSAYDVGYSHMDTLNIRIRLYLTKGVNLIGVQIKKYRIFQIDNLTTFLTSGGNRA